MIKLAIRKLVEKKDLDEIEAKATMNIIMEGKATNAQIAAFLIALRMKNETVTEITEFAKVMRKKATKINAGSNLVDTCGTGGDCSGTFNISTAAAFVAAGAGVKIAKHGNRSVSSNSGSADVIEKLGVNIDITPKKMAECIEKANIGFLFALLLHGAMKYAVPVRKELGVRTVFNVLGPLTNPAGAEAQVLGVFDSNLTESLANVLKNLGTKRAFVVHGNDGLDEITTTTTTRISELNNDVVKTYDFNPGECGIRKANLEEIKCSSSAESAEIIQAVMDGKKGAARDIVILNAAAAIAASGKVDSIKDAISLAEESIDSGKAKQALEKLKVISNDS